MKKISFSQSLTDLFVIQIKQQGLNGIQEDMFLKEPGRSLLIACLADAAKSVKELADRMQPVRSKRSSDSYRGGFI
jgi:hypothetical protein